MQRVAGTSTVEGFIVDWVRTQPEPDPPVPVSWLTDEQVAAELQRIQRNRARDAAREAEAILRLAELRSDRFDPPPDAPGARTHGWAADGGPCGASEFLPAELSMVLNVGRGTASHRAYRARVWRENLPATFAALRRGELDERRAGVLADVLQHTDPQTAGQVEARLLPDAVNLSFAKLEARARELMLALDAAAVDRRREQAKKVADVHTYPSPLDGMSTLAAELPAEDAAACYDLVDQLARMLKADGDERPISQLRTAVFSSLLLRPAGNGLPNVAAHLTITAPLSALSGTSRQPGEVNGQPITAAHLRELLTRLGALCPGGLQAPEGGDVSFAITDAEGRLLATVSRSELQRLARRGCREHPDGDCDCPVLGPPPATDAYEPTDRQRLFVKTRDRTCRFPNCGQRVG